MRMLSHIPTGISTSQITANAITGHIWPAGSRSQLAATLHAPGLSVEDSSANWVFTIESTIVSL